jgi:DNA-binding NarL/FixJ family response regulator
VTGAGGQDRLPRAARDGALVVLLEARDPARRRDLAALLAGAGHALARAAAAPWDVALVDLGAAEDAPAIAGGPLVLLADHLGPDPAAPAVSVLPRGATARQVEAAVSAAAAGLSVRLPDAVAPAPQPGFARDEPAAGAALLTPREVEILALVGDGASNKAVARRLGISAHTVKFHLEAVFRKLGVATRARRWRGACARG